jgi:alpha-beta hydrolase superfamily lysophospholipase
VASILFPENYQWDLAAMVAVNSGGAAGEVLAVASALRQASVTGDVDAWYREWSALAERVEATAGGELTDGHQLSAAETYQRAAIYHQICDRVLEWGDERKFAAYRRSMDCFERSLEYRRPRGEVVSIPYEATALRGYFLPAAATIAPTVIFVDGFDVTPEILAGRAESLPRRGIHLLVVDGPGYGSALRLQKLRTRYDYEAVVGAAVDYLETRPDVAPAHLGLIGNSLGGYYSVRAAAYEKRIKACAAWGALWDFHRYLAMVAAKGRVTTEDRLSAPFSQALAVFGVERIEDAVTLSERFKLEGVMKDVTCALLVVHGESDKQVPVEEARLTYECAASRDKELVVIPSGTPGEEHCQWDNIVMAQHAIFDWLAEKL